MSTRPTVGLTILAWRAPETLAASLTALEKSGLKESLDEVRIQFQEISEADKRIADQHGIAYSGTVANYGIRGGISRAVENLSTDLAICCENDYPPVIGGSEAATEMQTAIELVSSGQVDVYWLRRREFAATEMSRVHNYQRYWGGTSTNISNDPVRRFRRLVRPQKADKLIGSAAFASGEPEKLFPHAFERLDDQRVMTTSRYLNWTNNPCLYNREWFLKTIVQYAAQHNPRRGVNGMPLLEIELNCQWWRDQNFRIGIGPGIFTHCRLDRPEGDEKTEMSGAANAKTVQNIAA